MDHAKLRQELTRDEGRHLTAYRDSLGFWTIGVGHLLGDSPRMSTITEEECDALLNVDIAEAEAAARRLLPEFDRISDPQQRAFVNMVLNRGEDRVRNSSRIFPAILAASEQRTPEAWAKVRQAMSGTQWAGQVGKRADRLATLFEQMA